MATIFKELHTAQLEIYRNQNLLEKEIAYSLKYLMKLLLNLIKHFIFEVHCTVLVSDILIGILIMKMNLSNLLLSFNTSDCGLSFIETVVCHGTIQMEEGCFPATKLAEKWVI